MAEVTATSAGTGSIATGASTPMDKLLEQLVNATVAPTINSLLDISASEDKTSSESITGTKTSNETGTGTKTSTTSAAAQNMLDQQIASLQASLADNNQYGQLIDNIMAEAAKNFNPTNTVSRRSGAFNSTTLDQLRNDAQARATAQAADSVLADKRAKLTQLVELIGQNVNANKTEDTATNQTGTTNASQTNTGSEKTTTESNRIGSGAANVAKVGAAAMLAKSLLGTDVGKTMTTKGLSLLKKLFDVSGNSTGLPDNWFDDLSNAVADPSAISSIYDDTIKSIFGDVTETGLPAGWFDDAVTTLYGSENAADSLSQLFSDSGISQDAFDQLIGEASADGSLLFTSAADNAVSSGAAASAGLSYGAGAISAITNAADGEWGGNDTASTVGATLGSYFGPIGSTVGSWVGNTVGEGALDGTESYLANSGGGLLTGDTTLKDMLESGAGFTDMFSTDMGGVHDLWDGITGLFDGCFITTACMKQKLSEFSDDCHELQAMRELRDQYIRKSPDGENLIQAYYKYAPAQVEAIEKLDNAAEVWEGIYTSFILPCVAAVDVGNYRRAALTYLVLIEYVKQTTGIGE